MGNATSQLDVAVSFGVVQALRAFQVHACSGNFQATEKKGGGKLHMWEIRETAVRAWPFFF